MRKLLNAARGALTPSSLSGLVPGATPASLELQRNDERYKLIRYAPLNTATGLIERDRRYAGIVGTHFYVHSLISGVPIAVRLGDDSNPFIPIEEGDTIIRPRFEGVTIRHLGPTNVPGGTGDPVMRSQIEMLAYISNGELVRRAAHRRRGLRRQFAVFHLTFAASPSDLFGTLSVTSGLKRGAFLARGASFAVRNNTATRVWLWWGSPGDADLPDPVTGITGFTGWPIEPGQSATFDDVEELRTSQAFQRSGGGGIVADTGTVMISSGTLPIDVVLMLNALPVDTAQSEFLMPRPEPGLEP